MKKYIVTLCFLVIASFGFSQTAAAEGTYQLIQVKKAGEVFTTELLYFIEENRHATEEVIISITASTMVRILPTKRINSAGFIPLVREIISQVDYDYMKNYIAESENKYKNYAKPNKKKKKNKKK